MSIWSKIFGMKAAQKSCPRCLGKGHVDWADIKRLDRELIWIPGKCAYCNGSGMVERTMEERVPVDLPFLVINSPEATRKKIIAGDSGAMEVGHFHHQQINATIDEIVYLHLENGWDAKEIFEYFLSEGRNSKLADKRDEVVDYIERVIQKKCNV
ncbi:MAG: hypothetical protein ACK5RG_04560 [Cyclobacteriaceae bacterium]|jgi:hypothetical protein|nr:hypothetical protein [Flammeovirgaceae bacterium]